MMPRSFASHGSESSRLRVLFPLFDRLHEWNARVPGAAGERPATVLIGGERLAVESWERGAIARWPEDGSGDPGCRLVMEGLACMAKTLSDMERLRRSTGPQRQAELMLDGAIGMALVREVQHVIDRCVERGALEEARQWGSLQHRVRHTVSRAMRGIAYTEHPRVKQLADTLTDLRLDEGPVAIASAIAEHAVEPEAEPEGSFEEWVDPLAGSDDEAPTFEPGPSAGVPGRTKLLGLAFAVSLVLCGSVVWLSAALKGEPPTVDLSSFEDAGPFLAVAARPPSLYVDVDGAAWEALTHMQKWRHVEQAADVAAPLGYHGVLLREAGGRPLAQWLRGRGIALLDESAVPVSSGSTLRFE